MTDPFWAPFWAFLATPVVLILNAIVDGIRERRKARLAADAALKVEQVARDAADVKSTLAQSSITTIAKLDTIHGLVNSEMAKAREDIRTLQASLDSARVELSVARQEISTLKVLTAAVPVAVVTTTPAVRLHKRKHA